MDDNNVSHLKPVATLKGVPNPDIVEQLERMLQLAKDGKLTDVALAAVQNDGDTVTFFVLTANWAKLIGTLEYVKHRVVLRGDD